MSSRHASTPLAVFSIGSSTDAETIELQSDHLLLERVVIGSRTESLIFASPCRLGDCIHEPGGRDRSESEEEKQEEQEEEAATEQSQPPGFSATSMSFAGVLDERVVTSQPSGAVYLDTAHVEQGQQQVGSEEAGVQIGGDSPEGMGDTVKDTTVAASSTGEVSIQSDTTSDDEDPYESKIFEGVSDDRQPLERDFDEALKQAMSDGHGIDNSGVAGAVSGSTEDESAFPDESYKRRDGTGGAPPSDNKKGPSKERSVFTRSHYDLSALTAPKPESEDTKLTGVYKEPGSSILKKLIAGFGITITLVVIGGVLLFTSGGTQTETVHGSAGGFPAVGGAWNVTMWANTEQGQVAYSHFKAAVSQNGGSFQGDGSDPNGGFRVAGNLGQEEDRSLIAFTKQYTAAGPGHPFPVRFAGAIHPQDSSGFASGNFQTKLVEDNPELGKSRFDIIDGTWSAKRSGGAVTSGIIGKLTSGGSTALYAAIGGFIALIGCIVVFVRGRRESSDRLRGGRQP